MFAILMMCLLFLIMLTRVRLFEIFLAANMIYNIKFTIEKSTNTLQFLDVDIKISENTVVTWVWRKPTITGLFLNFAAICSIKWKSGLEFCMLHRAKLICSRDSLFLREVEILKSLF